ncbi:MAG: rhodanese-like domain-containing protein [Myxococcota bacterium]|nr:rhodanese-like domain-containing protein [Myxococcota bacterium]
MLRRIARRIVRTIRKPEEKVTPPKPSQRTAPPVEEEEELPELEVDGDGVAAWVAEGKDILFLDIREPHEINYGHIRGATLIPMNSIPQRLSEIPAAPMVVVYCAAGARSYGVAHYLREQGIPEAWSLIGGIGAWLEQDKSAWMTPPHGAPLRLTSTARLSDAAAERHGRTGAAAVRSGTIQASEKIDGVIHYVIGLPEPDGGLTRIDGLTEADLETSS